MAVKKTLANKKWHRWFYKTTLIFRSVGTASFPAPTMLRTLPESHALRRTGSERPGKCTCVQALWLQFKWGLKDDSDVLGALPRDKILHRSEWMLVVCKSCVSLLCWIKKGEKHTKGCGSSSFQRSWGHVIHCLHFCTGTRLCGWTMKSLRNRSRGKIMPFFQRLKSFPPHLGFCLGFLRMLTDALHWWRPPGGGAAGKRGPPAWAGRSTTSPNTILALPKLQLRFSLSTLQTLPCIMLACSEPACSPLMCFREPNHPRTSTKQCIFTFNSLAGSSDRRSSTKEAAGARHPVRHPAAVWHGSTLSVSNHSHARLLGVCGCSFLRHLTMLGECYSLPCYLELISGEGNWFLCWPLLAFEPTKLLISEF